MKAFLFLLGTILVTTFFVPKLLFLNLIIGASILPGVFILDKDRIKTLLIIIVLVYSYFNPMFTYVTLILGLIIIFGSIFLIDEDDNKKTLNTNTGPLGHCIERKVINDILIIETYQSGVDNICALKGLVDMDISNVETYQLYKKALNDALDIIHERLKQEPNLKWLWYI